VKRDTRTAFRARAASMERLVDSALAEAKAAEDAAWKLIREQERVARELEAARVKFTATDLANAVIVRDEFGWHRVVRVNRVSVTVATAYSWTNSIPLAKVLEFREAKA